MDGEGGPYPRILLSAVCQWMAIVRQFYWQRLTIQILYETESKV